MIKLAGCDEKYDGSLLPACQSGCGFQFDSEVTGPPTHSISHSSPPSPRPRSDAPIPIFSRPVSQSVQSHNNPFMNIFRSQGPVVIRRNINLPVNPFVPQAMAESRAARRKGGK